MAEVTAEDIAAMKKDGSFSEFVSHLGGNTQKARPTADEETPTRDPNRRPGAWPDGTRSPGPAEPRDPAAWDQAVTEYRAYLAGDFEYDGPPNCQCSGCYVARTRPRT